MKKDLKLADRWQIKNMTDVIKWNGSKLFCVDLQMFLAPISKRPVNKFLPIVENSLV
jgi:hypothetical protein